MSTAPAPRPFEAFDDDFDADLDFDHLPAAPARAPMPFTAGSDAMPADGYNPVGEVVAQALGRSEAACRQLVHRARSHVQAGRPRFAAPPEAHAALLQRFAQDFLESNKEAA